ASNAAINAAQREPMPVATAEAPDERAFAFDPGNSDSEESGTHAHGEPDRGRRAARPGTAQARVGRAVDDCTKSTEKRTRRFRTCWAFRSEPSARGSSAGPRVYREAAGARARPPARREVVS